MNLARHSHGSQSMSEIYLFHAHQFANWAMPEEKGKKQSCLYNLYSFNVTYVQNVHINAIELIIFQYTKCCK